MNYRGDIAYQQQSSPNYSGRDNYYTGATRGNDEFRNINNNRRGYHREPVPHSRNDQRMGDGNYQSQQINDGYYMSGRDRRESPPPRQSERGDEYGIRQPNTPAAVHRYPQTFQNTNHRNEPREQRWENRNASDRLHPQSNYGNNPAQNRTGYDNHNRDVDSLRQNQYTYEGQQQYRDDRLTFRNQNEFPQPAGQLRSSSWREGDLNYPLRDTVNDRNQQYRDPNDIGFPYQRNQPNRNEDSMVNQNKYSSSTTNNYQSYQSDRRDPTYQQPDQSNQRQHDSYRDSNFQKDVHELQETPQVLAKTSGSTAVFGIVARVDTSPTRRNEPVTPPNNAPPLSSPTNSYAPHYDEYQERDTPLQRQAPQTQHRPSPPQSPRSRGQSQQPNWQTRNDVPDQYGRPVDTNQSWQTSNERSSYPDNRRNQRDRIIHNEKDMPVYDDSRHQYPDNRPQQQQHTPRQGFRDYDYTESSGYGSESTHYTERSHSGQQQHWGPPKGGFGERPPDSWTRLPENSIYSQILPSKPQNESLNNNYEIDKRNPIDDFKHQHSSREQDQYRNFYNDQKSSRPDQYGPLVSLQNLSQKEFDDRQQGPRKAESQYGHKRDYDQDRVPTNQMHIRGSHSDFSSISQHRDVNPNSGVERPHITSVRAAKNMFEKQTDPKRPPPAPKPIVPAKPNITSNVNTRPVPPRPRNFSEGGWDQERKQQFSPQSRLPPGPISPYDERSPYGGESQQYSARMQPFHSQSMDNLAYDERSRYQSPNHDQQHRPQHAKSMHNLDERSRYPEDKVRDSTQAYSNNQKIIEGYRNSYSGNAERPMVLGVKYNNDAAPSVNNFRTASSGFQEPANAQERPQTVRNRSRTQSEYHPQQYSPTRSYGERKSWSNEPTTNNHQQSYNDNNRNAAPYQQSKYTEPRGSNEIDNYVPDVVARSYELANQATQQPVLNQQDSSYANQRTSAPPQRDQSYNNRSQPIQNYQRGEDQNMDERWPTPPPPILDDHRRSTSPPEQRSQRNDYTDDWRRPGPHPQQSGPPQYEQDENMRQTRQEHTVRFQSHPQEFEIEGNENSLPPPPKQPYPNDSDSSEVDVDAPTPPPSGKHSKPPKFTRDQRGNSAYERNKPIPVGSRDPDSLRRQQYQPKYDQAKPEFENQHHRDIPHMAGLPQPYHSKPHPIKNIQSPRSSKPQPKKPQRNSAIFSPQATDQSPTDARNEFDFDVRNTPPLSLESSRERLRLGKSGALANRKPPSRTGSTSNLVEVGTDEFQIEVTDSELSQQKGKIEVHREESMRILRAKKDSSSDTASSILERTTKQRASQRVVQPPKDEASKKESKLVYKLPSAEVTKTVPMPQITEPATQAGRRPPTYLGFGHSPEKPKTDLLSQFKNARDSAMKTASEKQDRALKGVSALVKFSHGKKEPKAPPKPKLTPAEKNAKLLNKMHVEVKPGENEEHHSRSSPQKYDDNRSSVRSSSTIKAEKYDGDDDTTNGSRHDRDRRGRGRDRNRDDGRGKSRGRSTSRGREISPDDRNGRSRHRSTSRERALSPSDRHKSHKDYDDRRHNERRRHADDPPYHRRPPSPDRYRHPGDSRYRPRSPPNHQHPQPYDRHGATREPDWVEQFRRGRERSSHPTRRAWVNDPRRVEVAPGGRRRELDIDAFEKEVRKATSYNSDFEQPEARRQMIPAKLTAKSNHGKRQPPPGDWMNALKEKNRSAAKARLK